MTPAQAYHVAMVHRQSGRLAEAEALLRQLVQVVPDHADGWHQLGLVVLTAGRATEAVEFISKAAALTPGNASVHSDLGVTYWQLGRGAESMACCERAIALTPNVSHMHRNLGDVLHGLDKHDEAIASYERALAIAPQEASTHNNLGNVYNKLDRLTEAAACYARAVQLDPRMVIAQSNLGDIFTRMGRPEEGLACAQRALALDPNFAEGYLNMGVACWQMRRFAEAEACYRRAISLRGDFTRAHLSLGILLLLLGRYEEGWREYEWHCRAPTHPSRLRDLSARPWDGSVAEGQTIIIHADQGIGDAIQCLRYLPLALAQSRAARLILECQAALVPLVRQLRTPQLEILSHEEAAKTRPPHDLHIPLFNVPLVMHRFAPEPITAPYLRADEALRARWRTRLTSTSRPRVGIAWAGNPTYTDDRRRSMSPEVLLPLLRLPGVTFVSLQVVPRGPLPPLLADAGLLNFNPDIADFADSAALVAELDLIITVDTSTAHLAGALGRPVWVMIPFIPDWRWGPDREDTPWYPTMRLFRQSRAGDWPGVIERVAAEFQRWRDTFAG